RLAGTRGRPHRTARGAGSTRIANYSARRGRSPPRRPPRHAPPRAGPRCAPARADGGNLAARAAAGRQPPRAATRARGLLPRAGLVPGGRRVCRPGRGPCPALRRGRRGRPRAPRRGSPAPLAQAARPGGTVAVRPHRDACLVGSVATLRLYAAPLPRELGSLALVAPPPLEEVRHAGALLAYHPAPLELAVLAPGALDPARLQGPAGVVLRRAAV